MHLPLFIKFISHHMFCLKLIKKLNGVDEFDSEIGYTTEFNGDGGCNATKIIPVFSSWSFTGSFFWKGIQGAFIIKLNSADSEENIL